MSENFLIAASYFLSRVNALEYRPTQGAPARKFSDINSPMVVLAPRGAKTTIGELISENFQNRDLVLPP